MPQNNPLRADGIALRYVPIAIVLPGYILLLLHGLLSHLVAPAIGIAPLTGSAIQSTLIWFARTIEAHGGVRNRVFSAKGIFFSDILLVTFHLAILIATTVILAIHMNQESYSFYSSTNRMSDTITGVLCTLFNIVPMFVHLYYAVRAMARRVAHGTWDSPMMYTTPTSGALQTDGLPKYEYAPLSALDEEVSNVGCCRSFHGSASVAAAGNDIEDRVTL